MCSPAPSRPLSILNARGGTVIPVINSGDNRTVGIITPVSAHGFDAVVILLTPAEALQMASELADNANR